MLLVFTKAFLRNCGHGRFLALSTKNTTMLNRINPPKINGAKKCMLADLAEKALAILYGRK